MATWNRCAICGRAIPVGELCYGIKNWRGDPDGGDTICRDCLVPENAPALTPPNEWINMEDRTPEFPGFLDHIMVVTCDKNGYVMPMVRERTLVGYEWVERWLYPWNKIYDGPEITHWMPLPKPPKVTEDVAENATTTEHSTWHEWIKERFDAVR